MKLKSEIRKFFSLHPEKEPINPSWNSRIENVKLIKKFKHQAKDKQLFEISVPFGYVPRDFLKAPYGVVDIEMLIGAMEFVSHCPICEDKSPLRVTDIIDEAPSFHITASCPKGHNVRFPGSRKLKLESGASVSEVSKRFIDSSLTIGLRPKQIRHQCALFGLPVPSAKKISEMSVLWTSELLNLSQVMF